MAFSQILKRTLKASIKMVELYTEDDSSESTTVSNMKTRGNLSDTSQSTGATLPFVKIEGQIITGIESMVIDETGTIPAITLVFKDSSGQFGGPAFPKKNLKLSVYLKTSNPKFMPLRGDYLITTIKSITDPRNRGAQNVAKEVTYLVKGELFVPRLYSNVSKSYSKLNSRDTLFKVASELGLGFVENDFAVTDTMTWINMNSSPFNFIKDVAAHAYSDDDSFFETFISKEANLSMIEVSKQLMELEIDSTFLGAADSLDSDFKQDIKGNPTKTALDDTVIGSQLTTEQSNVQSQNYILEASLISNQGKILKDSGYKKKIYYYDHILNSEPIDKFQDFFMAPVNTPGVNELVKLVPEDEGLSEVGVKKWMDINYGNTHGQWNAARLLNSHNNDELEKIQLRVVTRGINSQAVRGMSIFTNITQAVADYLTNTLDSTETGKPAIDGINAGANISNPQLSGIYYIKGAKYYYDKSAETSITTELFLSKREWRESKKIIK